MNAYGNGRIRRTDSRHTDSRHTDSRRTDSRRTDIRYTEPDDELPGGLTEDSAEEYPEDGMTREAYPEEENQEEEPESGYADEPAEEEPFAEEENAPEEPVPAEETVSDAGDPLEEAQQLATNRTVMLACTLAAMMSPFAAFLLWAEKRSRAIRHNSVQSVALGVIHLVTAAVCFGSMALLGRIPLIGYAVTLFGWLLYFGVLVWVVSVRLRLMRRAWLGLRYDVPLLGSWLERFV